MPSALSDSASVRPRADTHRLGGLAVRGEVALEALDSLPRTNAARLATRSTVRAARSGAPDRSCRTGRAGPVCRSQSPVSVESGRVRDGGEVENPESELLVRVENEGGGLAPRADAELSEDGGEVGLTVLSARKRRAAIWRLVRPSTTSASVCFSRWDSAGRTACHRRRCGTTIWPAHTARTVTGRAVSISDSITSAEAPASMALCTPLVESEATRTIGTSGKRPAAVRISSR